VVMNMLESIQKKDKSLLQRFLGWGDKDEPTIKWLLGFAEPFIRTQRGLYKGCQPSLRQAQGEQTQESRSFMFQLCAVFRPTREKTAHKSMIDTFKLGITFEFAKHRPRSS
jgi:hypothetical protein